MKKILKVVTWGTHYNEKFNKMYLHNSKYIVTEIIEGKIPMILKFPMIKFWLLIKKYDIIYFSDLRHAILFKRIFGGLVLTKSIAEYEDYRDFLLVQLLENDIEMLIQ